MNKIHLHYVSRLYFYPGFHNDKYNTCMFLWHREDGTFIKVGFLLKHPRWRKFGFKTYEQH